MDGSTNYIYQPDTPRHARSASSTRRSNTRELRGAAPRSTSRTRAYQFDNVVSLQQVGLGGDHLFKGGVQFARLYYESDYDVLNDMYLNYNNGVPTTVQRVQHAGRLDEHRQGDRLLRAGRLDGGRSLTLNLGVRYDHNTGILPEQSTPRRHVRRGRSRSPEIDADQAEPRSCGAPASSYDPIGNGQTALKASYSRYGLQVGIDRVTNVNPLTVGSRDLPVDRPEQGRHRAAERDRHRLQRRSPALTVHYAGANGPRWPYSDEVTAGIEHADA